MALCLLFNCSIGLNILNGYVKRKNISEMKTLQWKTKFRTCYSEDVSITFVSVNLACADSVYYH